MKKTFLLLALGAALYACSSDSKKSNITSEQDTTLHHPSGTDNSAPSSGENHMKAMHDAMDNSIKQMHSMKASGDPDYDFAALMRQHHQGAINMAKAEIAGGADQQLKQMAQKMIDEQQMENAAFDRFMQAAQPSGSSDYGQRAMGMMTGMSDIKMESGSLDAMFASMMIPHHQDAVKMAEEYLKVGKNGEIKKIAQDIVKKQPKEIEELQDWLSANKKS